MLRFLARALTDAPVMIIATYRSDELTRRHPLRPFLAEVGRFPGTVRVEVPSSGACRGRRAADPADGAAAEQRR